MVPSRKTGPETVGYSWEIRRHGEGPTRDHKQWRRGGGWEEGKVDRRWGLAARGGVWPHLSRPVVLLFSSSAVVPCARERVCEKNKPRLCFFKEQEQKRSPNIHLPFGRTRSRTLDKQEGLRAPREEGGGVRPRQHHSFQPGPASLALWSGELCAGLQIAFGFETREKQSQKGKGREEKEDFPTSLSSLVLLCWVRPSL